MDFFFRQKGGYGFGGYLPPPFTDKMMNGSGDDLRSSVQLNFQHSTNLTSKSGGLGDLQATF